MDIWQGYWTEVSVTCRARKRLSVSQNGRLFQDPISFGAEHRLESWCGKILVALDIFRRASIGRSINGGGQTKDGVDRRMRLRAAFSQPCGSCIGKRQSSDIGPRCMVAFITILPYLVGFDAPTIQGSILSDLNDAVVIWLRTLKQSS
jgi:hypothetical protein